MKEGAERRKAHVLPMSADRRQACANLRNPSATRLRASSQTHARLSALTLAARKRKRHVRFAPNAPNASLIGHSGSSAFRPTTTTAVSMSLTGSCFSSESAPGPSIMGVDDEAEQSTERPCCNERQVQAIGRTHLIHRPARDIIPPQGGARVSSYRM